MIKKLLTAVLSGLMALAPMHVHAEDSANTTTGTAGVRPTIGMTYYGSGGRTLTLSRKIPTMISVYTKSGTVPNIQKVSGTYGSTTYQALKILPTGDGGTFLQVDHAYSDSDKTPKMMNNIYDKSLTADNNYYWVAAINASFFNNNASSSEYGAPIGAVISGGIQNYKPYNDNWQGKPLYGSGYTTAFWNKNGAMKLSYEGWKNGKYYRYAGDTSPVTWDDGQTWSYTEGVSGAYSLYVDGTRADLGLSDSIYKSGTYTATTLFGQRADGTYVMLVDNSNLTVNQQAALMHDQLGCTSVIRMDGGGSSQMAYNKSLALSSFTVSYSGSTDFVDSTPDLTRVRLSVTMDSGDSYSDIAIADTGATASIVDSSGNAVPDWSAAPLGTYYIRVTYMDMPAQTITIRKGVKITMTDKIAGTTPLNETYYTPVTVNILGTDSRVASSDTPKASGSYTLADTADIASWSVSTSSDSSGAVTITATPTAVQKKTVTVRFTDTDAVAPQDLSNHAFSAEATTRTPADITSQAANAKAALETAHYTILDAIPTSLTYDSADVTIRIAHEKTVVDSTSADTVYTRTIRYLDTSGNALMDPTVQTIVRTDVTEGSTTDLVTGQKVVAKSASTTWSPSETFDAVTVPVIDGYTADQSEIAAVAPSDTATEVTVTYTANTTPVTDVQYLESDASGTASGSISVSADTTGGTWTSASDGSTHAAGTYIVQIPASVALTGNIGTADASASYEVRVIGGMKANQVITVTAQAGALTAADVVASDLSLTVTQGKTSWTADEAFGTASDAGISGTAGTDTVRIIGSTRIPGVFTGAIIYTSAVAGD